MIVVRITAALKGLGNALGFLIGALVLGTAFPHLLKGGLSSVPWQVIIDY